jgi:ADP-ribosylglycohydrolase
MRAAPIGAYFHDDYDRVIAEARASAAVTHAHPDGQTGAIAIALAAAWMSHESNADAAHDLIPFVLEHLPKTETFFALKKALRVPTTFSPATAALILGNGSLIVASDTVPFCLWCVCKHPTDYRAAIWSTVSGLGDRDTTCAIVGGIVAMSAGRESIPQYWLDARETIRI